MLVRDAGCSERTKIEVIDNLVVVVSAQVNNERAAILICIDGVEVKEFQAAFDCCKRTCLAVKDMEFVGSRLVPFEAFIIGFVHHTTAHHLPERQVQGYFNRHKGALSIPEAMEVVELRASHGFVCRLG